MNAQDMIFNAVYKKSMEAGANERMAKDNAIIAVDKWMKGAYKSLDDLIKERIQFSKKGTI